MNNQGVFIAYTNLGSNPYFPPTHSIVVVLHIDDPACLKIGIEIELLSFKVGNTGLQ